MQFKVINPLAPGGDTTAPPARLVLPAVPPAPEEMGWKDTVKSMPGEITRVIAKFDVPPGTALPAEYVYHCHILEHEENEMMRPFQVIP